MAAAAQTGNLTLLSMILSENRFPLFRIMLWTMIQTNWITAQILCFEHDLVRKPVSTFPDHALKADPQAREPTVGRKRR
jgi:hypothetical protein